MYISQIPNYNLNLFLSRFSGIQIFIFINSMDFSQKSFDVLLFVFLFQKKIIIEFDLINKYIDNDIIT